MNLDSRCITIISTEDTEYFNWQKKMLFKSWQDCGHLGDFINIQAHKKSKYKEYFDIIDGIKTFHCDSNPFYDNKKDLYPPYNKPLGIKNFLEKISPENNRNLFIIDPDCLFIKNCNDILSSDKSISEHVCYMDHEVWKDCIIDFINKEKLADIIIDVNDYQPLGIPTLIKEIELRKVIDRWIFFTQKLRSMETSPLYKIWTAEMWGFCIALAEQKIKLKEMNISYLPYKNLRSDEKEKKIIIDNKYKIIHYCLGVGQDGNIIFDKKLWQNQFPPQIIFDEIKHSEESVLFFKTFNSYLKDIKK